MFTLFKVVINVHAKVLKRAHLFYLLPIYYNRVMHFNNFRIDPGGSKLFFWST